MQRSVWQRTISFFPTYMPKTKLPWSEIIITINQRFTKSIRPINNVVRRPMPWTLTICLCLLGDSSKSMMTFERNMPSGSSMCWLMSIKIPTLCSSVSFCSLLKSIVVCVSSGMTPKVSMASAVPILITSSIFKRFIPKPGFSS